MRNLRASFVLALAACGGGSSDTPVDMAPPIDQPPPDTNPPVDMPPAVDLSCMGNAAPTTGPDPVPIDGTVSDIDFASQSLVPVQDALVSAIKEAGGPGDSDMSDAAGAFTLAVPNQQQVALDGHLEASKAGQHPVRLYPPSPLSAPLTGVPLLLLNQATLEFFLGIQGITLDPTKGEVGLVVVDCSNNPVANATPSVTDSNGNSVGEMFDASMFQEGLFIYFNITPGVITVGATFDGNTFRAHDVDVVASTTSTTAVRPGF